MFLQHLCPLIKVNIFSAHSGLIFHYTTLGNGPSDVLTLFADSTFIVPPYQRAYAWVPEPHLRNFIEDLRSQSAKSNRKYFFGTILLAVSKDVKGPFLTAYSIVDGQQRLTTACIFAAVALRRLQPDADLAKNPQTFITNASSSTL